MVREKDALPVIHGHTEILFPPVLPAGQAEGVRSGSISDEGFVNLTTAIIQQAKDDVLQNAPGTLLRQDAEAFFMSETFYGMTDLDGFDILCRLQDKYDEKMRKKEERKRHVSAGI